MSVHVTPRRRRAVTVVVVSLLTAVFMSPAGATSDALVEVEGAVPEVIVKMTRLPGLDGTTEGSSPPVLWDINNQGHIVGQTFGASPGERAGSTPTLWRDGHPTALPVDNNDDHVEAAFHVNERGQVLVDSGTMPYLWTDGVVADLPIPNWEAVDLNDRGQVLMHLDDAVLAVWEAGDLTPIALPGDPGIAFGNDLSEAGHVVGGVWGGEGRNGPFIWQDGTFTWLGPSGGEAYQINRSGQIISSGTFWDTDGTATQLGFTAWDLNDRGQVVGSRTVNGVERAVLWEDGKLTDLGTLGGADSRAQGINELGQVVGVSDTADDPWHHFVWIDGQMIDLGGSWDDSGPKDINDHGQIIGRIRHVEDGARVGSAVLWEVDEG